jgi:hypothetical protein
MSVCLDDIADLSPNMRKVFRENSKGVHSRDTYWITIQGMASRGLLSRPKTRRGFHPFTKLGLEYRTALLKNIT